MIHLRLRDEELQRLGESGYFVRDGWLGMEGAQAAARAVEMRGERLRPAGVSRAAAIDRAIRGDAITWIDPADEDPTLAQLATGFIGLGEALREQAYLGVRRQEVQLARYPGDGSGYQRHQDAHADGLGQPRRVTAIYYLNRDWQPTHGGLLRLHLPAGAVDVAPLLDRLVVFLSERVEHEVLPVLAPRWAATAWYYGG